MFTTLIHIRAEVTFYSWVEINNLNLNKQFGLITLIVTVYYLKYFEKHKSFI